jgi:hypothetical protein
MTPNEILKAVANGEISMQTVNESKNVAAYYTDPETGKHYIGFVDPKTGPEQLEVKKEEFETLVSVGRVMSRFTSVRKTPNGMNGLLKILSMIEAQNGGFRSESDLLMN